MEEQASLSSIIIEYSVAFLMIIIILISVLGNLMVCLAICIERRIRNAGAGNWFLISLALADLLVGLLVMTLSLAYSLLGQWVFGELMCRVWISMDVMCCTSSILNLCAICIDRFLHIKDPYNYDTYMSRKMVLLSILVIWSVSAFISFVPLNLGWHKLDIFQFVQPLETTANNNVQLSSKHTASAIVHGEADQVTINQITNKHNQLASSVSRLTAEQQTSEASDELKCDLGFSPLYAVVSSSISFYLPCIIMVALYTRLYLCARKHVRDIRKQFKPVAKRDDKNAANSPCKPNNHLLTCVPNTGSNRSCRSASNQTPFNHKTTTTINQHIADHKAAITIGIILSAFLLCWIPFFLMNIYLSFCNDCVPSSVFTSLTWLGWCNSALNPIIYTIINREFRSAFYRLLTTWPLGNCSLLKLKHRFSATAQPSHIQAQQQMELRCSRATGSSECSAVQPVGAAVNNIQQQTVANGQPRPQPPPQLDRSKHLLIEQSPSSHRPHRTTPINTLQSGLPYSAAVVTASDSVPHHTEAIQLQSNLSASEEIKRQPEPNLANKNELPAKQAGPPTYASEERGSLKLKNKPTTSLTICDDEQQEKTMMVSITKSSKDAVIV